jgi:hypothetical protein
VKPGKTTKAPAVRLDRAGTITGVVTGVDGASLDRVNVRFRYPLRGDLSPTDHLWPKGSMKPP